MQLLDNSDLGKNNPLLTIATIGIIVLSYIIGSTFLLTDIAINFPGQHPTTEAEIVQLIGKNRFLIWIIVPFLFVIVGLLSSIHFLHKRPILSLITARKKIDFKRILFSFLVMTIVLSLFLVLQIYTSNNLTFQFNFEKFLPLLLISLFLLPIQTTCEELIFRGYALQGIKRRTASNLAAILISGTMFGAIHYGNPEIEAIGNHIILYYILVGIFLSFITYLDDGMELALGYHAANNIFAAIMVTNNWQAFQTDALFLDKTPPGIGWDTILGILIVLPTLFFIFKWKYKWEIKL
ncbi:MAG: CPBP family intramembrane metalloprotease [Crocinitomicaceae bacterium]|nr:CPBP family intramembrane metalloprotease [Crocinitomicaceae bacterium]